LEDRYLLFNAAMPLKIISFFPSTRNSSLEFDLDFKFKFFISPIIF